MAHPLIPLLILVILVLGAAVVGYVIWGIATDIADKTQRDMEKRHVSLGKEGIKIGLKEVREEDYVAKTQNILVKAWNYSSWPAYKSRFWNKDGSEDVTGAGHSSGSKSGHSSSSHNSSHNTLHKR